MSLDVIVPQMGESVLEGTILEWKVKVGDKVKLNQSLVELMTDKVNIEIPAEADGTITELLVKEGDVVPVGAKIAVIENGQIAGKTAPAETTTAQTTAPSSTPTPTPAQTVTAVAVKPTAAVGKGRMSPKVRVMIREYSLEPSTIAPTGKDGLITVEDVMRSVESRTTSAGFTLGPIPQPPKPVSLVSVATQPQPSDTAQPAKPLIEVEIPKFESLPAHLRETKEPVAGIRKLISEHMLLSIKTSPHVTTFEDLDLTELVNYRNEIKGAFKQTYGANITFMPFIVKAVCLGLKEFPKMNATMTDKEITYKNYYNIGIAVAREDGLIVPVIKDADKKTLVELAVEINQLGEKARTNKLLPDDVSGGTFSLTNAGMFGATSSTPIINQPQVAILGIHAIVKKPWVVDNEIIIRHISSFGLSFDHRLIDGHIAVQFLHRVHEYLSDVKRLLLHLR